MSNAISFVPCRVESYCLEWREVTEAGSSSKKHCLPGVMDEVKCHFASLKGIHSSMAFEPYTCCAYLWEHTLQITSTMRSPPPGVMATWPPPNFGDPDLQGQALVITQAVLVPAALSVLAARLFVRVRIVRRWGWDDALMVLAWVSTSCCSASNLRSEAMLMLPRYSAWASASPSSLPRRNMAGICTFGT